MEIIFTILVIVVIIAVASIKTVEQSQVYIVERLGKYRATLGAGVKFIIPFVDRVRARVSLKEQMMDVEPQNVITKDNVTIRIDTVVFYQITDAKKLFMKFKI